MIAMEMTNDEIAQKLFVAKRTVDTHRQNLIRKLDVKNTVGLLRAAYKLKLVKEWDDISRRMKDAVSFTLYSYARVFKLGASHFYFR